MITTHSFPSPCDWKVITLIWHNTSATSDLQVHLVNNFGWVGSGHVQRMSDAYSIVQYTGTVRRLKPAVSHSGFPAALTRFQRGRRQTGCSWILLILTSSAWRASARRQHLIPIESVLFGNALVSPGTAVRDLGVYIDTDVTMRTNVTDTVRACFAALCQISSVRRAPPQHALLTLVPALVITKLDQWQELGSCGYFWVSAGPTAVSAQCRRSARLLTPDVRTHYSIASGTTLVTRPGVNPVECSGIIIACTAQHQRI